MLIDTQRSGIGVSPAGKTVPAAFPPFINRDLSLLEFFRRVLDEATTASQPLLERLKFLSIVSSNLDEFFMVRVSALKEKVAKDAGMQLDGLTRPELLAEIRERVLSLIEAQARCLKDELMSALRSEGIDLEKYESLSAEERSVLDQHFDDNIYPLLTPQAVDPTHPFPYISGASLNLGLKVRPTLSRRVERAMKKAPDDFFVRIKVPASLPRLCRVTSDADRYIPVEDLIRANIRRLIPEASPADCHLFRITRDADILIREEETEDLLHTMEETIRLRRYGDVVRLEVSDSMPAKMVDYLAGSLNIAADDVYSINGPLDLTGIDQMYDIDRPELKAEQVRATLPHSLRSDESIFDIVKRQDVMLHHPYMPYTAVTDFIRKAVDDPDVLAIKICLYRIGEKSPIAPLLIEASERGKQVTVLIEIKARFDESKNIEWGKRLEESGVHVVYGMLGLKTHCKTTLVIRREHGKLVRYVHIATGNYNPETSAFYTDLGMLTANPEIGADATELFNYLTAYSQRAEMKRLLVAPIDLREKMIGLIEREAEHARGGRPARMIAKMNRLADPEIVTCLYAASAAGVEIDLIVRGICTLRAGIDGLSENIRVRSIVGNLLEHSRVYYFRNAGNEEVFIGSADWMPRNLDRRVEVLAPVLDPSLRSYFRREFLDAYLRDNTKAREQMPDGTFQRVSRPRDEEPFDSQSYFRLAAEEEQIPNAR
ncbi:MAG: polyphosphate kinase 1 [Pyrinomonadaceae bacterium]